MPRGRPSKTKNLEEFLSGTEMFPILIRYTVRKVYKERLCRDPHHRFLGIQNLLKHFRVEVKMENITVTIYRPDTQEIFTI